MSNTKFKEKMAENKAKREAKRAESKAKFEEFKVKYSKGNIKDTMAENKEKMTLKSYANSMEHAYVNNKKQGLDKLAEKIGNPDTFADLFHKEVYEQGGEYLAEMTIDDIIHGKDYIRNMKSYQNKISDYNAASMIIYMDETGYVVDRNCMTDDLCEKLNHAAELLGYTDTPYPMVTEDGKDLHDEEKVILNPFAIDPEIEGLSDDERKVLRETKRKYEIEQAKHPMPTPTEFKARTDEEIDAEKEKYFSVRRNPMNGEVLGPKKAEKKEEAPKTEAPVDVEAKIDAVEEKVVKEKAFAKQAQAQQVQQAPEPKKVDLTEQVDVFEMFNEIEKSAAGAPVEKEVVKSTKSSSSTKSTAKSTTAKSGNAKSSKSK